MASSVPRPGTAALAPVGGANNTSLRGLGGNDVLIGGPAFIVFLNGGGGSDTRYRRAALIAIPSSCETYYP